MLPDTFVFPGIRSRVVFGFGTISQIGAEIDRLGRSRALVLSTPQQEADARQLSDRLGMASVGVFSGAAMHTPAQVTDEALKVFTDRKADCVVAIGGGSTIGLGKAIATRTGADQVVIPTTYAGSEMTDILGETSEGRKVTQRDPSILPETVIYDVDLTLTLPRAMTVTSALNSIAHAAEALYAKDRNPIISLMSVEAVRSFNEALPTLVDDLQNREARKLAAYGAWLGGIALGGVSMALHHKICHTLGGTFNTPHADTHAIMLPHTVAYNAEAVPELLAPLGEIFGTTPGRGLFGLSEKLGAPVRLRDLGLSAADLDKAADMATENPYSNPRPIERDAIRALLQDALEGRPPKI